MLSHGQLLPLGIKTENHISVDRVKVKLSLKYAVEAHRARKLR